MSAGGLLGAIRSGEWLTPTRLRDYSIILIGVYLIAIVGLVATSHGGVDYARRPLGSDFSDVWAAGRLALQGHAAAAYDPAKHYAMQQAAFHRSDIAYYGWAYPPSFLLLASGLALSPYLAALSLWQCATAPIYLATMSAIAPGRKTLLLATAFPGVFMNLTHGQNGFFTVALLGGGLLLLDRRPLLAGVLFGLLAYKPQFGLILPLALMAGGRWKAFAAAAACVALTTAICTLAFGADIWRAFVASLPFTRIVFLEQGNTGFEKLQSVFGAVRLWGGSVGLAYAVQAVVTGAVAIGVVMLWRSGADARLKAAGLLTACLLATPYCLDYDLMLLAPAVALIVTVALERGFRPYEISFLALTFIAPVCTRGVALATHIPLGLIATLGVFALALDRAVFTARPTVARRSA